MNTELPPLTRADVTAADRAARPAETVSESVPTRDETPDVAELRRRLDALTVAQPCVMKLGEVYDFAWCETHDRTFALGGTCDHAGLSHVDYLDDDGQKQRGRAVRAEMERDALLDRLAHMREARDSARAEVERLAAMVERVRDWLDRRGVDVSDRDGAYIDGYRAAQRHMVMDARELRDSLDGEVE